MKESQIKATMQVGKQGITQAVVEELVAQLKKRGVVKVKLLRSARDQASLKEAAADLALRTGARLVDARGGAIVLSRTPERRSGQGQGSGTPTNEA